MSRVAQELRSNMPRWIALLVLLSLVGNVVAWLGLGLMPEEAYYWTWSQRLELSYYDHPPLVAWLMALADLIFGSDAWALRLPAVFSWLVGAVFAYRMAQRIYSGYAGALALLVWASLPIVQVGLHIVTPDSALIIFSWLTLWFAWRAGMESRPALWLCTGVMGGLAMLGKYPAVLLFGGVFFALLTTQRGRAQLATPWPWLAVVVSLAVFSPVIIWNAQHDWLSFAFQFSHGVKEQVASNSFEMFMAFLSGQLLVAMPWSFFAMAWSSLTPRRRQPVIDGYSFALLAWNFWLPLLVFGLAGLTSLSGPNWPESAYVTGTLLLGGALNSWLRHDGQWRRGGVPLISLLFLFSVVLINLMRFPFWVKWVTEEGSTAPHATQLSQSYGWDRVWPVMQGLLQELPPGCTIVADSHTRAGMVAWLSGHPERVVVSQNTRISQYHVWMQEREQGEEDYCLYLQQYDSEAIAEAGIPLSVTLPEGRFERVELVRSYNPDRSLRWYGLHLPAKATPTPDH